jgi:asparagine synthase (glutamine-hydrolysing)
MGAVSAVKSKKGFNTIPILKKMMETQKHRGNENLGIATNHECFFTKKLEELDQIQSSNVAIAYNMSKIEPSDSPQPIVSLSRSLIIESDYLEFQQSFNQLVETLSEDTPERSLTKFVSQVDGQYEIAILHDGNIVVARDPIGLKPLYYGWDTDFIALSTEKKALWNLGIKKTNIFPPGHIWRLDHDSKPSCVRQITSQKFIDDDKVVITKRLGNLLRKAVLERSLKSKQVGVSFSGGLDSSLIAHILSQNDIDVVGLVVGVKGQPSTEWAEKAAKLLGINLEIQEIDEDNLENILKENIWRIEEADPVKLSLATPFYLCAKLARNSGITRVFTGQGADELFGGYHRFLKILDEGDANTLDEAIFNRVRDAHEDSFQVCEKSVAPETVRMIHPYADWELIQYGLSIPSELKISKPNDKLRKHILRKAAIDIDLPKQLAEAPKKAIQYSTGMNRRIEILAKSKGMKTKQYVNQLFKDIFVNFNLRDH